MRFHLLYSFVHFWTTFSIKIFMVPLHLSCRICDRGSFGSRLFRLSLLTVCYLARRDLPPCCFFSPETHVSGFRATYSGISGLSEAFLRERLLFYLGFKHAQHVYTQTTLTLTFVKLVVRECPLKSLVCHERLWTIQGYPDISKIFLIPSPISGRGLLLNSSFRISWFLCLLQSIFLLALQTMLLSFW